MYINITVRIINITNFARKGMQKYWKTIFLKSFRPILDSYFLHGAESFLSS